MKKNINKPEADIDDLAAALSLVDMIYMQLRICMEMAETPRKYRKSLERNHKRAHKCFKKLDWVNGLAELQVSSYRKIYRTELKKLLETDRKQMAKSCEKYNKVHGVDKDVNSIISGLLGTKKMYEYLTGEDLEGKKIHEGYFDGINKK